MTFSPEISYKKKSLREAEMRDRAVRAETEDQLILANHSEMIGHLTSLKAEVTSDRNFQEFQDLSNASTMIAKEKYGNEEPLFITDIFYRRLQGYGVYKGLQSEGLVLGVHLQKKEETKFILYVNDQYGERDFEVEHDVAPMKGWRGLFRKKLDTSIPLEASADEGGRSRGRNLVSLFQTKSTMEGLEVYQKQVDKSGESGFDMVTARVVDLNLLSEFNKWLADFNEIKDDKTVEQIKAFKDEVVYGSLQVRLKSIQDTLYEYEANRYEHHWSQYISNAVKLAEKKLALRAKPIGPMETLDPDIVEFEEGPDLTTQSKKIEDPKPSKPEKGEELIYPETDEQGFVHDEPHWD